MKSPEVQHIPRDSTPYHGRKSDIVAIYCPRLSPDLTVVFEGSRGACMGYINKRVRDKLSTQNMFAVRNKKSAVAILRRRIDNGKEI